MAKRKNKTNKTDNNAIDSNITVTTEVHDARNVPSDFVYEATPADEAVASTYGIFDDVVYDDTIYELSTPNNVEQVEAYEVVTNIDIVENQVAQQTVDYEQGIFDDVVYDDTIYDTTNVID
ncbi:MAG: hypothetical protein ATN33_08085 [Epulopiscium sp. Nele67-Bin001]|nr:MAG: hypothetical protein ATN33_08085 [Epulopiscium sp. Nele67-Bin001]